jgi:hypothetical protein
MRRPLILLLAAATIMAITIIYGLAAGSLITEAGDLLAYPWYRVTLIDLYIGFFIIGGWVAFREARPQVAIIWIILFCLLGNLATAIYAVLAILRADGDWRKFWMGSRA